MISRTKYKGDIYMYRCRHCDKLNKKPKTYSTFNGIFNGWDRPGDRFIVCKFCDGNSHYCLEDMDDKKRLL